MNTTLVYKDSSRPVDERVEDLLSRMTLEEKVAQMLVRLAAEGGRAGGRRGPVRRAEGARALRPTATALGQVGRPSDAGGGRTARQMAELTNAIQRFFVEESRLGIPVIFHEECLHGHAAPEAHQLPAADRARRDVRPRPGRARLHRVTAAEARARGTHQALTPVVDVAREPRWGRVEETFGEDPYLVGAHGRGRGAGLPGRRPLPRREARARHHEALRGARPAGVGHQLRARSNVSMRVLRDVFLPAFKRAISGGGALSVMPSYNEIDGVPSHANRWLLDDVLRKEWGFRGFIVSDYFAIRELNERPELYGHHLAHDTKEAAALAVRAGVDIELPDPDCYPYAGRAGARRDARRVADRRARAADAPREVPARAVRRSVRRSRRGRADRPRPGASRAGPRGGQEDDHAAEERRAALLPLDPADDPDDCRDRAECRPRDARRLQRRAPALEHRAAGDPGPRAGPASRCCTTRAARSRSADRGARTTSRRATPRRTAGGSREAATVAARADVVVLAIGDNEQTSREAWALNHLGDRAEPRPRRPAGRAGRRHRRDGQADRRAAVQRPARLGREPGGEGRARSSSSGTSGRRAAGRSPTCCSATSNPGGKLPITIPRSVGHVPAYYNHKPSARRGYLFESVGPAVSPSATASATRRSRFSSVRLEQARDPGRRIDARLGGRHQHGGAGGRRGGPALHPRPGEQRHAAGEGAEGLPTGLAGTRRDRDA